MSVDEAHACCFSLRGTFSQEASCLGAGDRVGDDRRTADLFTLGRQEALLGTVQDLDASEGQGEAPEKP